MTRPTCAQIDLAALKQNYLHARQVHGRKVLAVMKANAYGHGLIHCAQALQDLADGYAVAFLEEAITLREHGIRKPILILEGVFDEQEMQEAIEKEISVVVHHADQVRFLDAISLKNKKGNATHRVDVWIKVDTGMHRLGFHPAEIQSVHRQIKSNPLVMSITLMTHFSRADESEAPHTDHQIRSFDKASTGLDASVSLCNSAGLSVWPMARRDIGRAGLMIYGTSPVAQPTSSSFTNDPSLSPVMTLTSKVMAVRNVPAGESIGYGGTFITRRPTRIGVVAIGYGDGYPRHALSGTPVLIDQRPAQLIGRVCMDMMMVDLTDLPDSGIGSQVELWGKSLDIRIIAQHADTVPYDLLTGVMRIKKSYVNSNL